MAKFALHNSCMNIYLHTPDSWSEENKMQTSESSIVY